MAQIKPSESDGGWGPRNPRTGGEMHQSSTDPVREITERLRVQEPPSHSARSSTNRTLRREVTAWIAIVACCSLYANLSFAVRDPSDLRFFPPFRPGFNG